nr:MAG TPA: hypothetical protein [Caudoviricetes sp.]
MNESLMGRGPATQMSVYQESKELSEIKGKMFLARQFPRDPEMSLQNVLRECGRKDLAEAAQYEFPRGDSVVKGPSIRLVEVLARHWGNIMSGITEVDVQGDTTTIKCFAWDLETNASDEKTFSVKHERSTKKGSYKLTDERDIYEMVANKGARRKRACLLAVMPGWYVDAALEECDKTLSDSLTKSGESLEEIIEKTVNAFAGFGITPEQICTKLNKEIDKLSNNDIVKLRHLYSAIKDGFVKATDAFGIASGSDPSLPTGEEENALETLNKALAKGKEKKSGTDA